MLPHVDSFRACHSLASLEELVAALARPEDAGEKARLMRALADCRTLRLILHVP